MDIPGKSHQPSRVLRWSLITIFVCLVLAGSASIFLGYVECTTQITHPFNNFRSGLGVIILGFIIIFATMAWLNAWMLDQQKERLALNNEQLNAALKSAEEASKLKSNFMAKISHELRSPLNGIIGFAEMMYHGKLGPIPNNHKEYLSDILTSARHLLILINDVLDIAKVEAGRMEFYPEKIDFNKIFNETKDIFQSMISAKNIQVDADIDPALPEVNIDPARFKQVLYNYVSNALKYTPDGGRVVMRVRPHDEHTFRLEVQDTGIGIRKEDLPRLFIEFQQLDREIARQYPSTGLGLALTKHIVEAQGGHVLATSEFGKGSTFIAILPYSQ